MTQRELIALIEQTAPLHLAASWDHSGIQVVAHRPQINHLAVCLDPTPSSVRTALDCGADMVLSHHPLLLTPRFLDRLDGYHETISLLLKADVPLYAAHTSLDSNPGGPVAWLPQALGLTALQVLEPVGGASGAATPPVPYGIGLVGNLPDELSRADFIDRLLPYLGGSWAMQAGGELPLRISRVAVCPGSGGSLVEAAADLGAQLLITGDIKYHTALESPIPIIDVGHFMLEEEMMRRFAASLRTTLPVTFLPAHDPMRPLPTPQTLREDAL